MVDQCLVYFIWSGIHGTLRGRNSFMSALRGTSLSLSLFIFPRTVSPQPRDTATWYDSNPGEHMMGHKEWPHS